VPNRIRKIERGRTVRVGGEFGKSHQDKGPVVWGGGHFMGGGEVERRERRRVRTGVVRARGPEERGGGHYMGGGEEERRRRRRVRRRGLETRGSEERGGGHFKGGGVEEWRRWRRGRRRRGSRGRRFGVGEREWGILHTVRSQATEIYRREYRHGGMDRKSSVRG
jgi:hypothetical protein